jgi:hypothetical protein
MRPVFAALGYTALFGAVVGAVWLRYLPVAAACGGPPSCATVAASFAAAEPSADYRHSAQLRLSR